MSRRSLNGLSILILLVAVGLLFSGSYIHAKARLAQYLIASAWQQSTVAQGQNKPWPWADTWPVARLRVPQHGIDQYVLAGASGESLAFGPAYDFSSASPTQRGNTIIAAHRDTHFTFLKQIAMGNVITVESVDGKTRDYVVRDINVVDKADVDWIEAEQFAYQLTLVTCYPFNAIQPGGRLRYVVRAVSLAAVSA